MIPNMIKIRLTIWAWDYPFSAYVKLSEKPTVLTPQYAHTRVY